MTVGECTCVMNIGLPFDHPVWESIPACPIHHRQTHTCRYVQLCDCRPRYSFGPNANDIKLVL